MSNNKFEKKEKINNKIVWERYKWKIEKTVNCSNRSSHEELKVIFLQQNVMRNK